MFLQAVKGLGYRITTKDYETFSSGAKKADLDLDLDLGELFGVGFGHSCGDAQYFRQPVKGNDAIGWRLSFDDGDRLEPEFRL